MKRFLLILVACLSIWACTKEEPKGTLLQAPPSSPESIAALQELAQNVPNLFSHPEGTKSPNAQTVTDIIPFADIMLSLAENPLRTNGLTRTSSTPAFNDLDTAAVSSIYVVNYGINDGFAILSDDARIPSILAYASQGNLTTETDPSPGLEMILENIPVYTRAMLDSIFDESVVQRLEARPDLTTITDERGPLITTQWDQDAPFNNLMSYEGCLSTSNGRYPAGCVAVAMAQIMTYHGYPAVVGGISHNWAQYRNYLHGYSVPSSATNSIATLLYDIGQKVNMQYDCAGSGSNIFQAENAFINYYNYLCDNIVSYTSDYFTTVKNCINNNRPLYLRGQSATNMGHAWVLDGYATQNIFCEEWHDHFDGAGNLIYSEFKGIVRTQTKNMLHFNLGWGGIDDGYYLADLIRDATFDYRNSTQILPNIRKASNTNKITLSGSAPNWTLRAESAVTSTLSISCAAADTMGALIYTLPAGTQQLNITNYNYVLTGITSISPSSDNNFTYTY